MVTTLIASAMLLSNVGLDWLNSNFDTYDKIQKQLYEYAEPGYMEQKSSELFIQHLEENGFKVERGVACPLRTVHIVTILGEAAEVYDAEV